MRLLPNGGENSPHTAIVRVSWEIIPTNPDGTYSSNQPVDIGVLLLRTDENSFEGVKNKLEDFLTKNIDNKNFFHIFKRGTSA